MPGADWVINADADELLLRADERVVTDAELLYAFGRRTDSPR